jgi:hypothetical protein
MYRMMRMKKGANQGASPVYIRYSNVIYRQVAWITPNSSNASTNAFLALSSLLLGLSGQLGRDRLLPMRS